MNISCFLLFPELSPIPSPIQFKTQTYKNNRSASKHFLQDTAIKCRDYFNWGLIVRRRFPKRNFRLGLHKADQLSVTTAAVTAWSEKLTHCWHAMVVNLLYPPEVPVTFLHKYLEFATSLMNQDAERVSDRLRHLEECQTCRSFSLVHETPRIEKHFFFFYRPLRFG